MSIESNAKSRVMVSSDTAFLRANTRYRQRFGRIRHNNRNNAPNHQVQMSIGPPPNREAPTLTTKFSSM